MQCLAEMIAFALFGVVITVGLWLFSLGKRAVTGRPSNEVHPETNESKQATASAGKDGPPPLTITLDQYPVNNDVPIANNCSAPSCPGKTPICEDDRALYGQALKECSGAGRDDGLWGMALVKSSGNPDQTRSHYIEMRVRDLKHRKGTTNE